jgi:hypothetical protein
MDETIRNSAPAALGLIAVMAIAQPALAETEFSFGFGADGYYADNSETGSDSYIGFYPFFELGRTFDNGWRADLYAAPELYLSGNDKKSFGNDDPYTFTSLTITAPGGLSFGAEYETTYVQESSKFVRDAYALFVADPAFGRVAYGDIDSALGFVCLTSPGGTSNFAADDLANFGSCESFGFQSTLLYNTPEIGGYTVYGSVSNPDDSEIGTGDPSKTFSLALAYTGDLNGHEFVYTFGVERATEYKGASPHGGSHASVYQAGAAYTVGDIVYSASGSLQTFDDTDTQQYGIAAGLDWIATDRLLLSGGATYAQVADFKKPGFPTENQMTYGISAEYALIPDRLTIDAGVSRLEADSGDQTLVGVGFGFVF